MTLNPKKYSNKMSEATSNLRKVNSSNSILSASDMSRYTNLILPNVVSDALATKAASATYNNQHKLIPNDLYYASDNKVYNITGYTNSLDRVNHKHFNNHAMDFNIRQNTNNLGKRVDVIPEMTTASSSSNLKNLQYNGRSLASKNNAMRNIFTGSSASSSQDTSSSVAAQDSITDSEPFMIVSAPDEFGSTSIAAVTTTSANMSAVSPQTPSSPKVW